MSRRRTPFALLGLAVCALLLIVAPAASAHSRDRNHDRIPDKWEAKHRLSLKVNQAGKDQDRDGMKNLAEYKAGTDPRDADTDSDGTKDGAEDSGTVVSFADGKLTIKLYRNDKTVEGTVDDQSEIKCDDSQAAAPRSGGEDDHGDQNDQGDDNNDQGDDDRGDDNNDQGDDDQGDEHSSASCGTAQLTPGAVVHEAELRTTPDGLHFDEIKLAAAKPAA